jgi:hypothetical protein
VHGVALVHEQTVLNQATPACKRSWYQLSVDRGGVVVSVSDPCDRNVGFLDEWILFLSSGSSVVIPKLSAPCSRPTTTQKI